MVDPLQDLLPDASVWHLGLYRNEETAEPVGYYDKLPKTGAPTLQWCSIRCWRRAVRSTW